MNTRQFCILSHFKTETHELFHSTISLNPFLHLKHEWNTKQAFQAQAKRSGAIYMSVPSGPLFYNPCLSYFLPCKPRRSSLVLVEYIQTEGQRSSVFFFSFTSYGRVTFTGNVWYTHLSCRKLLLAFFWAPHLEGMIYVMCSKLAQPAHGTML